MANKELIHELIDRILTIEGEITLLQEDKKAVLYEHKEKLDLKAFNAALRVARIKSKLNAVSDAEFEDMLENAEDKICITPIP